MEIVQIIGLGFIVTMLIVILKKERPEFALQLSLVLSAIIFLLVLSKINIVLSLFCQLAEKANLNQIYLSTILKVIGIAYVTEFGAQICRDAGETAIAGKIELAGKLFVMVIAIPIIAMVVETIFHLI